MIKKIWFLYTFLFLLLIANVGCSQNLPDSYGVYAYADKGRVELSGQQIRFVGNLLQSIPGLKGASSSGHKEIKFFIFYQKDLNPKSIRLSKLGFKKGDYVSNIFGNTYVDVNLWTGIKNIDIKISPINSRKDMFKLEPKESLPEGFYALHFGGLENTSTIEASLGNTAFDFVIGNSDDYQSYEVIKKRNEEKITTQAETLLKLINDYFNKRDYTKMKQIYRPSGRILNDSEWNELTNGLNTWHNEAGNIIEVSIVDSTISDDEGVFKIQTRYEKKGLQNEKLVIKNIEGQFFVIALE